MKPETVVLVDQGVGFGGSLVVVARLAEALDPARYRPVIISAMDPEVMRDHVPAGVRAYRVKPLVDYVLRAKASAFFGKAGHPILFKAALYLFTVVEELLNLWSIIAMIWIIVRERAGLVHVNNSTGAVIAAMMTGRPVVYHLHGYHRAGRSRPSFAMRRAVHAISISRFVTDVAASHGCQRGRITTIYNPISPQHRWIDSVERTALRARYGFSNDHVVVVMIGRLVKWKGQQQFLQAMRLVWTKAPNARALIVGDDGENFGDYAQSVRQLAESGFPPGVVVFAGYQPDVDAHYQISDIAVHASIEPEPFGLVITEAMQNGLPVIGANTGAVPELIDDGVNGYTVDPMDTGAFADAILRLAGDAELRRRLGRDAMQITNERYNPSAYAAQVSDIYDMVLGKQRA